MGNHWSSPFEQFPAGSPVAITQQNLLHKLWEDLYGWLVASDYDDYYGPAIETQRDISSTSQNEQSQSRVSKQSQPHSSQHGIWRSLREWMGSSEGDERHLAYLSFEETDENHRNRSLKIKHNREHSHWSNGYGATENGGLATLISQNPRAPLGAEELMSPSVVESIRGSPATFPHHGPNSIRIHETKISVPPDRNLSPEPFYSSKHRVPSLLEWEQSLPTDVHSCRYCQLLFIDTTTTGSAIEYSSRIISQNEIKKTAAEGCVLFRWLRRSTRHLEDRHDRHFYLTLIPKGYASMDLTSFKLASNDHDGFDYTSHGDLGVYADPDDPAARYVSGKPLNTFVNSKQSLRSSRKWLAWCHKNRDHSACRGSNRGYIPKRVIRIDGNKLSLYEPSGNLSDKYAVLSYSWGGTQPYMTTMKNQVEHRASIPFDQLSKTVQDAITTTRHLRIKYLWVDCLCVIQDDDEDKIEQIKRLADIFQGAYVTISAASASSSREGFLHNRQPEIVCIPYKLPDGVLGALNLYQEIEDEPIHTRAWTLQEHVHSCRILEYGSQQLRRICRGPLENGEATYREFDPATFDKKIWWNNPNSHVILTQYWRPLVEHYSRRALTYPEDRPLAILGIAREYAKAMKATYVEGLWKEYIYEDLLWHRDVSKRPPARNPGIAPSWSWLSLDGAIIKWKNCEVDLESDGFDIDVSRLSDRWLGYLGGADTGVLKAKGHLREALWMQDSEWLVIGSNNTHIATIIPDADENYLQGSIVKCLGMRRNSLICVGLVLVEIAPNRYRRVGFFSTMEYPSMDPRVAVVEQWLNSSSEQKIQIE